MINLLPPSLKEELKKEEETRLLWILFVLVGAFFLCAFLLLLSLRIYLKGSVDAQEILLTAYTQKTASDESLKKEIKELNETVVQLSSFYEKQSKVSSFTERVSSAAPQGIRLTFFQYAPPSVTVSGGETKKTMAKVILSGISPSREELLAFREALQQDPSFANFDFPPSNWAKPSDIPFSFSFEIR